MDADLMRVLALILTLGACAVTQAATQAAQESAAAYVSADAQLRALYEAEWSWRQKEFARMPEDEGREASWSRQQAIDYMRENVALSDHEITTEVDRYIAWPAQAVAYKLGELQIRRHRREAEEALGPKFDQRKFHDAILALGAVPLPALGSA